MTELQAQLGHREKQDQQDLQAALQDQQVRFLLFQGQLGHREKQDQQDLQAALPDQLDLQVNQDCLGRRALQDQLGHREKQDQQDQLALLEPEQLAHLDRQDLQEQIPQYLVQLDLREKWGLLDLREK
jgi:hypothetical protein